ncbi:MAG: IS1182 family transposase [Steroidobacteraceae bacterium]
MARYKDVDSGLKFLAVDLSRQLLPGTFEHALSHLLDHELDLSHFDAHYNNDLRGSTTYPPAMLLKVVLFAYSQGIVSSRAMERACRDHVTFIALSGDSVPHFTTLAAFVSEREQDIVHVFSAVLAICLRQGLIGQEMFAIDGVKLPSNASKAKSGTRADFQKQLGKLEAAAVTMLQRHREQDDKPIEPDLQAKQRQRQQSLEREAGNLRGWLAAHPDRKGARGAIRKSNRTDNESAKMATSKGVIQGYTGVAAVDAKHQIIVEAQAHGTGSEQELLLPIVEAMKDVLTPASLLTVDSGYHSEANLQALEEKSIDALIADHDMRKRDERFATQSRHQQDPDPLHDKSPKIDKPARFTPQDFTYDPDNRTCICPAGKPLQRSGTHRDKRGFVGDRFRGSDPQCQQCPLRRQCLRNPDKPAGRQVTFFRDKAADAPESATARMKRKIDSPHGRRRYGRRFATVEPVFGNLRHNKRLNRFTLRGRRKVDTQWKLYCLVHNIEKLMNYGKIGGST